MAADITPFIADAQKLQNETGIPASVTLAQIILESSGKYAGGLSGLAAQAKNLFGIKGQGTAGSIHLPTSEYVGGAYNTVIGTFKAYNSYYDSMVDHAKVLSNDRYAKYFKTATSVNDYVNGIAKGGYATDPSYASKLTTIISSKNLHQYDTGNLTFSPMSASNNGTGSQTTTEAPSGVVASFYYYTIRVILLLTMFVLMIVFFMKAFPATNDALNLGTGLAKAAATGGRSVAKKALKGVS